MLLYLVGVDKEQDEEDQFSQQDDQQNDEKLKKIKRKSRKVQFNMKRSMLDIRMLLSDNIKYKKYDLIT